MSRLPQLPKSTDHGCVYVLRRGEAYKIGFSRGQAQRRERDCKAELILIIPTKQRPSQLEYIINKRFRDKCLPNYDDGYGGKREWFALTESDLDWLRGLATFLS